MKKGSTLFLRGVICFIGLAAIAFCMFVLPVGIRAEDAYGYRPVLLSLYVSAIPFLLALYQGLKLLHYIDQNKAFSRLSVKALIQIKYCGIAIVLWSIAWMPYVYIVAEKDDAPGVILIGLFITFASSIVATFAAVLQKLMQSGLELKTENDLTV